MFVDSNPAEMLSGTPQHLERSLHSLLEGDFREKWEATKRFGELGPGAIAALVPLLDDADLDWEVRWFVARALGQFEHPDALKALVQLVQQTPEPELVAIAAEGLSHFGEQGVAALGQLLHQPAHRLTGARALASIRHPAVFGPLLAAAEADPHDAAVRAVAIVALANFRHPRVDKLLLAAVKDPDKTVRREAITHLGRRSHLLEQVDLVDALLPGLWDLHPEVNQATAIALGRLGTEAAVALLSQTLSSAHTPEPLQLTIIHSLGWIERESALKTLFNSCQQLAVALQAEIAAALSRFQSPGLRQQAGEGLCAWLQNTDRTMDGLTVTEQGQLKAAIALALGNLRYQPAVPLLTKLQADGDRQTGLYAEAALRQLACAE